MPSPPDRIDHHHLLKHGIFTPADIELEINAVDVIVGPAIGGGGAGDGMAAGDGRAGRDPGIWMAIAAM